MISDPWAFGWDQAIAIGNGIAVLLAAGAGVWGVRTWRQERIDARQAEIAEEAMVLIFQSESVFAALRSPVSFEGEGATRLRPEGENESLEQESRRNAAFIPLERLRQHSAHFEAIYGLRPRLKALIGPEAIEPINRIEKLERRFRRAAILEARAVDRLLRFRTAQAEERFMAEQAERETVYWSGVVDPDPLDIELLDAIRQMETITMPFLRPRRLWGRRLSRTNS